MLPPSVLTDVAVVFRVDSVLGVIRLRVNASVAGAEQLTIAYGQELAARLQRVLSLTGWERTLDGIHADGSITPQLALRAFTIAYGPLPGVPTEAAPGGAPSSATVAMQMVARVWHQLSPAQQTAIDGYLGAPHDAKSPQGIRRADQVLTPDPRDQALAAKYDAIYHARIPGVPVVTIKVFSTSEEITTDKGAKALADAQPVNAAGDWGVGSPSYCLIRVTPTGRAKSAQSLELTMAHEAFHCVEFVLMADWRDRSDWIIEGMAEWASVTVDPVPVAVGGNSYATYLRTPTLPLFARAYSATGFWGHADEIGGKGSLWRKIPAILAAPDDPTSFSLAGGTASDFVDTWASAAWRTSGAGDAWNQTDPYALSDTELVGFVPSVISGRLTINSAPYTMNQSVIFPDPDNPLVQVVRGMGSPRVGTYTQDYGAVSTSDWFCLGTCKCPPGDVSTIPSNHAIGDPFKLQLALNGGNYTGAALITYHSLDEFCNTKVTSSGIMFFQHSVNGGATPAAVFQKGICHQATTGGQKQFSATSTSGSYTLHVTINPFGGFQNTYPLQYQSTNPVFVVDGPGGPFSNTYWPGGTPPSEGGAIAFSTDGKSMGLGFIDAWNADLSDDAVIAGGLTCKYSR